MSAWLRLVLFGLLLVWPVAGLAGVGHKVPVAPPPPGHGESPSAPPAPEAGEPPASQTLSLPETPGGAQIPQAGSTPPAGVGVGGAANPGAASGGASSTTTLGSVGQAQTTTSPAPVDRSSMTPRQRLEADLAAIQAAIANQKKAIASMDATLAAGGPYDPLKLKAYATAAGQRTEAYQQADPTVQALIDSFESHVPRNVWHSFRLAGSWAWGSFWNLSFQSGKEALFWKQYVIERERSQTFVDSYLSPEEKRLQDALAALPPGS